MSRVLAFGECGQLPALIRSEGHELLLAPGKSRALGLARDLLPDLVLLGAVGEPSASVDLAKLLAMDPLTRLLPLLIVLGSPDPALVAAGLGSGATDVVHLQMEPVELLARIGSVLRMKRLLEALIAEKQHLTLLELAGAVAHKMNQPLTSMSIIVETLLASHAREDLSIERLGSKLLDLQGLVDRMASIVKQVAGVVDYRTVDYVGDVKIIDLESRKGSGSE